MISKKLQIKIMREISSIKLAVFLKIIYNIGDDAQNRHFHTLLVV